jgi:hypothetical protein
MNEIILLCLQGFILGILSSLPFGAAASVIIRERYFRNFKSGIVAASAPIFVDVICFLSVLLGFAIIKPFVEFHKEQFQFLAGIIIIGIAVKLFTKKSGEFSQHVPTRNIFWNTLQIASVNILTAPVAFVIFLGGFANTTLLLTSIGIRIGFTSAFLLGAFATWCATLLIIGFVKSHSQKKYSEDFVKKILSIIVAMIGSLVILKSLIT